MGNYRLVFVGVVTTDDVTSYTGRPQPILSYITDILGYDIGQLFDYYP